MAYKVLAPERKLFTLEKSDKHYEVPDDDPTQVEIRTATIRQNEQREELYADFIRETTAEGRTRQIVHLPMYDLICRETFLTLVGCNITMNDKPLFRFKTSNFGMILDMTYQQFKEAWGTLPEDVALEIHEHVLEMNPHWQFGQGNANAGES